MGRAGADSIRGAEGTDMLRLTGAGDTEGVTVLKRIPWAGVTAGDATGVRAGLIVLIERTVSAGLE